MSNLAGAMVPNPSHEIGKSSVETLGSLFDARCRREPDRLAYAFVRDTLEMVESLTYAELHQQVCGIAADLVQRSEAGDRVLLLHPPGLDFVRAFWACVITGRIAVPVPAPNAALLKNGAPRLLSILSDASARIVMTTRDLAEAAGRLQEMAGGAELQILCTDELGTSSANVAHAWRVQGTNVTPESVAYLQYTSGSTSAPKGAILTHGQVIAQCRSGTLAQEMDASSRLLSWLPHHHDYGLVLGVLWPLFASAPAYILSPLTFLRRPLRWLDAIERFGITHSGGPNFAYSACVRAATQQPGWRGGLESLKALSCGAEPIQLETLNAFCSRFEAHGLPAHIFMPSFGMAETVLGVTTMPLGRGHQAAFVDAQALESHLVRRVASDAPEARAIVNCGSAIGGMEVRVVDPQTRQVLPADAVGELWVRGTSVGQGYWAQPEATEATFGAHLACGEGPFLRTGDFGFMQDGDVFVTGRLKDLIIVRGRNVYPQDLEWTAQATDGALRSGYGAAFSVAGEEGEEIVLVQEMERRESGKDLPQICTAIRKAIADEHELPMRAVVLVHSGSLPRTSSGKIRRRSCRQDYLDGALKVLHLDLAATEELPLPSLEQHTAFDFHTHTSTEQRRDAVEKLLLQRVAEHAGRNPAALSLDASAIECGLDSLRCFRVHQELESAIGTEIPATILLASPDLRSVAHQLTALLSEPAATERRSLTPHAVRRLPLMPLSAAQQRMWFWQALAPDTALYNITVALTLQGPLDAVLLQSCLSALLQRHEVLRMRWVRSGIEQRQRLETLSDWRMRVISLEDADPATACQQAEALTSEEAQRPFDLTREPAVRATLVRMEPLRHRLVWSVHHSVSDGQSLLVLVDELCSLYGAHVANAPDPLPSPGLQYLDFAAWESDLLAGGTRECELSYWKQQLAGVPAFLDLPTDRRRPPEQRFLGATLPVHLPAHRTARLRALAKASDVTLFMVLLAAWQTLLHRYSGQDTIVTASVMANRDRPEFDRTVGYFANTLALRCDIDDELTFDRLLAQVRQNVLAGFTHHHVPFEEVVDALKLTRDASRMPLTQNAFVLQPAIPAERWLGPVSMVQAPVENPAARFDLSLELRDSPEGLGGALEYDRELFDASTAQRMVQHLLHLLDAICVEPTARVDDLPLFDEREQRLQEGEWNRTDVAYPGEIAVHALIERQAATQPRSEALSFCGRTLDRATLDDQASRLAHHLRALGVGPDVLVGICMERSLDMPVAFLAVMKAGGAFVPLDPDLPQERLAYMLKDARPRVVLTQSQLLTRLPPTTAGDEFHWICVDTVLPTLPPEDRTPARFKTDPDHLAYVIYTSGSTGQPKGVMVSHRSLANTLQWGIDAIGFADGDRMLHKTTIGFDAILLDLVMPLVAGATVVLMPPDDHIDSDALVTTIRDEGITQLFVAPSQLRVLLESTDIGACRTLRYVICGGEALGSDLVRSFKQRLPDVRLGNFYGPTEAAIVATQIELSGSGWDERAAVPIGRPIANTRCLVLDGQGKPVPLGVTGELYIGGVGLARGYLGRPELTAERFLPHPWEQGERLYRTGDLVRWRADGQLEYLGRADFQVKIRGIRVELGEIEAALKSVPSVSDAVVVAREDVSGFKRLVAYVVSAEEVKADALAQALGLQLPSAMVPTVFVQLERLPTLPNGKLDRQALPVPAEASTLAHRPYFAPEGEVEQCLADIWAKLLDVPRVGRHDSFFELGGHSLIVVRMVEQFRQAGHGVAVRTVFSTPSLSALAAAARPLPASMRTEPDTTTAIPAGTESIEPEMVALSGLKRREIDLIASQVPGGALNIQDIYPLTPLQAGMLFHHRMEEVGDTYLVRTLLSFDDPQAREDLLKAFQAVIDRHDALRTAVLWEGLAEPMQVVLRNATLVRIHVAVPAEADALDALRSATDTRQLRMDLGRAPLVSVFTADDPASQRWLVALTAHHIVHDNVSLAVIFEEIEHLLAHPLRGLPAAAPYRDLVTLTRSQDDSGHTAYFQGLLGDVSEPTAPFGHLQVSSTKSPELLARVVTEPWLTQRIRQCARQRGTTAATLFHLAWALVVARTAGRDDVLFGTVLSGRVRESAAMERTVGLFINTLPLRVSLQERTVLAALEQVHSRLTELLQHELAPLSQVQRCSAVPGHLPLFGAVLNFRHSTAAPRLIHPDAAAARGPGGMTVIEGEDRTNYPLGVSVDDMGDRFVIEVQSASGIDVDMTSQMLSHTLQGLLDALEKQPEASALSIDPIPPALQEKLLLQWNRTERAYSLDQPVHLLIERQTGLSPDRTACVFRGQHLTYRELNERANRLAHLLRRMGVGPDVVVGLCVERSFELVIGYMAVVKAGGAFVPMDPEQPLERLQHILEDTAAPVVLTQSHLLDRLPGQPAHVQRLCIDTLVPGLPATDSGNLPLINGPEHLAYVIYTSGSTGRPKGVMVPHRALVNHALWSLDTFDIGSADRVFQKTTIGFDAAISDFFIPLMAGATIVLAEPGEHRDTAYLARTMRDERITIVVVVPSQLRVLLQEPALEACTELRHVMSGGEALDLDLAMEFNKKLPRASLGNFYGPSETTIDATHCVAQASVAGAVSVPIGRPIANAQCWVLDARGQLLPPGVEGELHIGGAGVARGYLNQPELTADRFKKHRFTRGQFAYRTGDRVRWLNDGQLEYLGRNDFQVKIRGVRIEPGEVEAALRELPGVRDAVVAAWDDRAGHAQLVAYVEGSVGHASEIRQALLLQLPEVMVPTAVVALEQLPRLPNGKLDRKALPRPELPRSLEQRTPPRTTTEHAVWNVWRDLLGHDEFGAQDDFFSLGGHSLLAMQVVARLRQALNAEMPLRDLFDGPTVQQMAAWFDGRKMDGGKDHIPAAPVHGATPLTPSQQGIWFTQRLQGGTASRHIPHATRLVGPLDLPALEKSLQWLCERHESLHSRVEEILGVPHLVAEPDARWSLDRLHLPQGDASEQAVEAALAAFVRQPLDLQRAPLARAGLLRISSDEHVLMLVVHHLVLDGWALGVLLTELGGAYAAFSSNQTPRMAKPTPWRDIAFWQTSPERLSEQDRALDYWRGQLEGLEPLRLPVHARATPTPSTSSTASSGMHTLSLAPLLVRQVNQLGQGVGATPFMVLLAAFKLVLMKRLGREDVAIGMPVAGRARPELEKTVGLLLNTLVLRSDLSDDPSFMELLQRVRDSTLDAWTHQALPFDRLVAELAPRREVNAHPFFDVLVNAFGRWNGAVDLPGTQSFELPLVPGDAPFPLTLYIQVAAESIDLALLYQTERLDSPMAKELLAQIAEVVSQAVRQPALRLGRFSLLTQESRLLLADPSVPLPLPAFTPVMDQWLVHAQNAPDNTAVRYQQRDFSHSDLQAAAQRLAMRMRKAGVRPGDVIAISGPRSVAVVGAMLACLMTGAVFVTLDPALPAARKKAMLGMSEARWLCLVNGRAADDAELPHIQSGRAFLLHPQLDDAAGPSPSDRFEPHAAKANDPAYIFFTSGSTGQPKAVLGRHHGLSHFLAWQRDEFNLGPGDRVSHLVGLSFDPVLRDILLPLTSGATLVIPQDRDLLDPIEWLARESISVVHTTPSVMQAWLQGLRRPSLRMPALRWVFVAGEPLTSALVTTWREHTGGSGRLVNLYGPTETTMARCFHVIGDEPDQGVQPVGRALPDSQALVISAQGQRCGIGETGEIVLRTPMRSLGYLHQPDENQRRFRPNHWAREPQGQDPVAADLLYFTGDLGRFRADGVLEVAGRQDDQIKVRGVRVEPAEVAAVLATHPAVRQCAVLPHASDAEPNSLVAYVVAAASASITSQVLRAHLASQLPDAFVPDSFVFLDNMPMQANGKVDRKRLPGPNSETGSAQGGDHVMPRSPLEQALWDIWRNVLRAPSFGVFESFFALGGHSLLATQVVARVRDVLGVELPLRALFETPDIAGLALEIERQMHAQTGHGAVPPRPAIVHVPRDRLLPTSYSQRRMWLVQQLNPETTAYNMPFAVRIRGLLDHAAVCGSIQVLVDRHEAFRTTLVSVDGEPMQRIAEHAVASIEHIDLQHMPAADREAEAAHLLHARSVRPYDLAVGPLHRPTLIQLGPDDHILFWSIHHAIGDGWSSSILVDEMAVVYAALLRGRQPELPPLPLDFADYASWQRAVLTPEVLVEQLAYWRDTLAGLDEMPLPHDRPRRSQHQGSGGSVSATFQPDTLAAMRREAAAHGVTPYMYLLACFQTLLGRYCGVTDVAVGTPIANRTHLSAEHLVGTLVNTIVMRTELSGNPTFAELLQRVRETALQAYAHQDLPFEALVEAVAFNRQRDSAPLVQVLFNVLNTPQPVAPPEGLRYEMFDFDTGSSQFDLALGVDINHFGMASLSYATDVFEPQTAQRMLDGFVSLVEQAVRAPQQPISMFDLLPGADRVCLDAWNHQPYAGLDLQTTVHAVIHRRAREALAGIALEQTGVEPLSHIELDERANRLAGALRRRGIGRGDLVGLCVDRGLDMVVAQLGILKSGAAYVPLDPAYPADRLAYMAEDAGLALLVSESALVHAIQWPRDRTVLLDIDIAAIASQSSDPLPPDAERDARPEDPAYVIYTSGSTGKPKGVVVQHRAVVNFLASMAREPGLTATDTLVAVTTLSFDIAVLELLLPLTVGARVVLANRDQVLDGNALRALIERTGATVMQATPSSWRMLIDAGWQGTPAFKALIGGEALPSDLAVQLLSRTGELWNMYGPTETTVWSTCWRVVQPANGIAIGKPIANTTVHVLDEHGQLCPIGVPGEIHIGGEGVTLGYLHRPELTAERFLPDPFASGSRLYRTGDRGRWRQDGLLEHQGRLDFQVKVRGHRIELGEIEAQLATHPRVARAVVIVREDVPGDQRLVAYLLPDGDLSDTRELREHLRSSLPDYMIPQHFVTLEAIPLLPNGKINRHGLPVPTDQTEGDGVDFVAPESASEQAVAEVWSRLLNVSRISAEDNFFDLGGHSLLAIRAVTELNRRPGASVTVRQLIFDNLGQIAASMSNPVNPDDDKLPPPDGGNASGGWLSRWKDRLR